MNGAAILRLVLIALIVGVPGGIAPAQDVRPAQREGRTAGEGGNTSNDVPLTRETITNRCRALHGGDAIGAPTSYARKNPSDTDRQLTVSCVTAGRTVTYNAAEFCPPLSGTGGFYPSDYGGEQGGNKYEAPLHYVCRGRGPLQFNALADVDVYCRRKGYTYGNMGAAGTQSPACITAVRGSRAVSTSISIADVCREMYGTGGGHEHRGAVYYCLAAGAVAAKPDPRDPGPSVTTAPEREIKTVDRPRPPALVTTESSPKPPAPVTAEQAAAMQPDSKDAASSPASKSCPDHEAELTNGERVFHRLYVLGPTHSKEEHDQFKEVLDDMKATLEAPGRQAPGSTTNMLPVPSRETFANEIARLKRIAGPCEEVTIYMSAHGGVAKGIKGAGDEKIPEAVKLFRGGDSVAYLFDAQFGFLMKGFLSDVSVTVVMSACFAGGFAGPANVEESKLVQVIGVSGVCRSRFDLSIKNAVDNGAKSKSSRVTAREVKDHLRRDGWSLGPPAEK